MPRKRHPPPSPPSVASEPSQEPVSGHRGPFVKPTAPAVPRPAVYADRPCPKVRAYAVRLRDILVREGVPEGVPVMELDADQNRVRVCCGEPGSFRVEVSVGWVHSIGPCARVAFYQPHHGAGAYTLDDHPWGDTAPAQIANWLRQRPAETLPDATLALSARLAAYDPRFVRDAFAGVLAALPPSTQRAVFEVLERLGGKAPKGGGA